MPLQIKDYFFPIMMIETSKYRFRTPPPHWPSGLIFQNVDQPMKLGDRRGPVIIDITMACALSF